MEEAIKLWHAERSTDSTVNLAALNCLSAATGWNGRNELGNLFDRRDPVQHNHRLVADARAMAVRLHLLDVPSTDEPIVQLQHPGKDKFQQQAHVAWDSYGWQS